MVDFPAPLKPVNHTQNPCSCFGGETSDKMAAISGRVNQGGNGLPLPRKSTRT